MGKLKKFIMAVCLPVALVLMAVAVTPTAIKAAGKVYQVKSTDSVSVIEGVINGTATDDSGDAYEGIYFPAGSYTYELSKDLEIKRDFTLETAKDAAVVFKNYGFVFSQITTGPTITFKGAGSITVTEAGRGISIYESTALTLNFESGSFIITKTTHYAVYNRNVKSAIVPNLSMNISGGYFEVSECSTSCDEGGIEWEAGLLSITNGATVVLKGNGDSLFGDLYSHSNTPILVSGKGTTLTITATEIGSYGMVLAGANGTGGKLTIEKEAAVKINQKYGLRGINAASQELNKIVISSGGSLTVTGDSKTSGIRRADVTVNDGILNVSGFSYALDGSMLNANAKSYVTLDGSSIDNGTYISTVGTNGSTITGGTVKEDPATSIVKGLLNTIGTSQVETAPVNTAGEILTRFDLTGKANSGISIAADPADATNHPAYTYTIGSDHSGTAYVWAPAVTVTFWPTKADYTANTTAKIIQTNYTIRGNKITDVNGSAPADPTAAAGMVFSGWRNVLDDSAFDPATAVITTNTNVYPFYTAKPVSTDLDIPIDLLVDNGDGATYINGPRDAQVGGTVKYSSTIDMSQIAAIAAQFTGKGYVTGSFTITLKGSEGVTPDSGFGTSSDINDYFAGGAIELFELTAAPTYDSGTNTITFNVKVKDKYNQSATAITGTECAAILNKGISGNSNYTALVNKKIAADGYARAIATFTGTLNYCGVDGAPSFVINMTGVQADPDNLKDPTLATLGSDPDTAVSATVTYKAPHPNTGDDSSVTLFIVLLGVSLVGVAVILIVNLTKKKNKKKSDQEEKNQQPAD